MRNIRGAIRRFLVAAVLSLLALGCTPDGPGAPAGSAAPSATGAPSPAASEAGGPYDY